MKAAVDKHVYIEPSICLASAFIAVLSSQLIAT